VDPGARFKVVEMVPVARPGHLKNPQKGYHYILSQLIEFFFILYPVNPRFFFIIMYHLELTPTESDVGYGT
jgi:hypothetical protein